jgi:tRNA threonylcarbamoyladenosine biosynthesis protein TsaE
MADESSVLLPDEAATLRLGAALAQGIGPGRVLHLSGGLGTGKTTLVRGLLRELGHTGRVKSPTYPLVELYVVSRLNLYHFVFYRF